MLRIRSTYLCKPLLVTCYVLDFYCRLLSLVQNELCFTSRAIVYCLTLAVAVRHDLTSFYKELETLFCDFSCANKELP